MWKFFFDWIVPPKLGRIIRLSVRWGKAGQARSTSKHHQPTIHLALIHRDSWSRFRELAVRAKNYAEFGCGESTLFMAAESAASVRSIDTDEKWISAVNRVLPRSVEFVHIDLGPVGKWGRPVSYAKSDSLANLFNAPFEGGFEPDFVLIDGRFRVATFLAALLGSNPGTIICFDDYVYRPNYHLVEQVLLPAEVGNRQAFFYRPEHLPEAKIVALMSKFEFVMD